MKRVGFRTRLFVILALFAVLPSVVLTLIYGRTLTRTLESEAEYDEMLVRLRREARG